MIRIGIDVGGTNTDAVVMDGDNVIAGVKAATTPDVMTGVINALNMVLEASGMRPAAVDVVMIGTTHFTNAVVQRRDLAKTAAVRLGLPATASLPTREGYFTLNGPHWQPPLCDRIMHHWPAHKNRAALNVALRGFIIRRRTGHGTSVAWRAWARR